MLDAPAIAGMVSGFKAATELVQLAINSRDAGIIKAKAIELQGQIFAAQANALTAQADQFTLLNRVRDLETEVAELKAWDAEKDKYELTNIRPPNSPHGKLFAFALKEEIVTGEPAHLFCERCFRDRIKSILQEEMRDPGRILVLFCTRCGAELSRTGIWYSTTPRYGATKPPRRPHS